MPAGLQGDIPIAGPRTAASRQPLSPLPAIKRPVVIALPAVSPRISAAVRKCPALPIRATKRLAIGLAYLFGPLSKGRQTVSTDIGASLESSIGVSRPTVGLH